MRLGGAILREDGAKFTPKAPLVQFKPTAQWMCWGTNFNRWAAPLSVGPGRFWEGQARACMAIQGAT